MKDKIHNYINPKVVDRIDTSSEGRLSIKQRDFVEYDNLLAELRSKPCEANKTKKKNKEIHKCTSVTLVTTRKQEQLKLTFSPNYVNVSMQTYIHI